MSNSDAPLAGLDPAAVVEAALHQLAAAAGSAQRRGQLLRLGLTAASVLAGQRAEARRWARRLWHALTEASGAGPMPQDHQQAPAWVRQPNGADSAAGSACSPVLHTAEAEHGHGRCWTLLPLTDFRPELVYPGAEVTADGAEGRERVIVVSTALWATASHEVKVLVTFHRPTAPTVACR